MMVHFKKWDAIIVRDNTVSRSENEMATGAATCDEREFSENLASNSDSFYGECDRRMEEMEETTTRNSAEGEGPATKKIQARVSHVGTERRSRVEQRIGDLVFSNQHRGSIVPAAFAIDRDHRTDPTGNE